MLFGKKLDRFGRAYWRPRPIFDCLKNKKVQTAKAWVCPWPIDLILFQFDNKSNFGKFYFIFKFLLYNCVVGHLERQTCCFKFESDTIISKIAVFTFYFLSWNWQPIIRLLTCSHEHKQANLMKDPHQFSANLSTIRCS